MSNGLKSVFGVTNVETQGVNYWSVLASLRRQDWWTWRLESALWFFEGRARPLSFPQNLRATFSQRRRREESLNAVR